LTEKFHVKVLDELCAKLGVNKDELTK